MTTRYDCAVIGGGFPGVYAAWRLKSKGLRVAVIEREHVLGGNLNSDCVESFYVDQGTHNFDLRKPHLRRFFEAAMPGDELMRVDEFLYGSVFKGSDITYGIEQPDLSGIDAVQRAVNDLQTLENEVELDHSNLQTYLRSKYGCEISNHLEVCASKFLACPVSDLASSARHVLSFLERPRLMSASRSLQLKLSSEYWNDRLGLERAVYHRYLGTPLPKNCIGYPKNFGMYGFGRSASRLLDSIDVDVFLGTEIDSISIENGHLSIQSTNRSSIKSKHLFWSMPDVFLCKLLNQKPLHAPFSQYVGAAILAFKIRPENVNKIDYIHDYCDGRIAFRYNAQGIYSNQFNSDGETFVCAEIYGSHQKLEQTLNEETVQQVINDMKAIGFISADAEIKCINRKIIPVAFAVPKVGFESLEQEVRSEINSFSENIYSAPALSRGRDAFVSYFEQDIMERKFA